LSCSEKQHCGAGSEGLQKAALRLKSMEVLMFRRIRAGTLPGFALALLMGPAALAAPQDEKPEVQQKQAPEDNKAYLPPWMQKPAGATASAAEKGAEPAASDLPADAAAKQKPAAQKRRHRDSIFGPGFSLFSR
jgi:hypothetical protein